VTVPLFVLLHYMFDTPLTLASTLQAPRAQLLKHRRTVVARGGAGSADAPPPQS